MPSERLSCLRAAVSESLSWVFFAAVVMLILSSYAPIALKAHPLLWQSLWSAQNRGYVLPGSAMESFKPWLDAATTYTLILDDPYVEEARKGVKTKERIYDFQNFLCPVLLNPKPVEQKAIVFCADDPTAKKRIEATGYRMIKSLGPGKGLAEKIP